ncbi:ABC transporter substrate-binding protein [Goodfellowiella coeruleoviolacea]|uniref:Carbohydrate ABC transporter substrate-binding protein, CUT1 family (TC 3.A.1.1.-) n=1 Tax=Goodfellowiella coeruleoviolacea TaxID=334858 RepID=A0AAE3GJT3_9PSEU|nr:ABC transporter substrate-binding protein [Goodfellowiella coeruleoviolacea]MCP2168702.1 carbohydrate ABC transporter substrate-binding protein, CUT1 family (TC 3.A.1.1.-) [Goodfellowiella coeruleoviolacea]
MARFSPRSPLSDTAGVLPPLGRRSMLKGLLATAGVAALPGLAACGSGGSGGSTDTVTFGSNYSDAVPKGAVQSVMDAFTKAQNLKVTVNTKDHNTYQEQITNYLQGRPDDVFCWFAGYRMQYFAGQGLASDLSDVWTDIGANFSAAQKEASTGADGKQYFVPFYYYPWAVFYRPSIWQQRGYEVPRTFDELVALAGRMKSDGLIPIAVGQKDGWPQMATLDYINLRTNGYEFHMNLMRGKEDWQGAKVRAVFENWRRLLPYYQENALGRTWQEASDSLEKGEAGMMVIGNQVLEKTKGQLDDLDFFAFPEIDPAHGVDTVEAPIDGFMLSRKPGNPDGAKKLLRFLGGAEAPVLYTKANPSVIATNAQADTSGYNKLQRKYIDFVGQAKHLTQFLDRDTDPRFASDAATNGINAFLNNPNDIDSVLKGLADQAKTIFTG